MGAEDLGARKDRSVYCKCPRHSRGLQRSALIDIREIFHAKTPLWWHQLASKWWPSRIVFCVCRGIILLTTSLFFLTGFPPGTWLCCCATNPMHITTLRNGMRHLWLPKNVSGGIQPMWRYGAVTAGSGCCLILLTCHLASLLYKRGVLLFQLSLLLRHMRIGYERHPEESKNSDGQVLKCLWRGEQSWASWWMECSGDPHGAHFLLMYLHWNS